MIAPTVREVHLLAASAAVAVVFGACNVQQPPEPVAPSAYAEAYVPLDTSSLPDIREVLVLDSGPGSGRVIAVHNVPSSEQVLTVHVGDGHLRRWDLGTASLVDDIDLGIAATPGVGFDRAGSLVMGPTLHQGEGGIDEAEWIGGVLVWDTVTGSVVACVEPPCREAASPEQRQPTALGAAIDLTGRWTALYNEGALTLVRLTPPGYSAVMGMGDEDAPFLPTIGRVAFASSSQRYAVAFREGETIIYRIEEQVTRLLPDITVRGENAEGAARAVHALEFSADDHWLGEIQGKALVIWSLTGFNTSPFIDVEVTGARLLAFDRAGQFVLVGTGDSIIGWDLRRGDVVCEFSTPGLASFEVSPDNRLLIWGDTAGRVHVWGSPGE